MDKDTITIKREHLETILTWLGDMTDNAEVDALNEPELEERIEEATKAYDLGQRLLAGTEG